MVMVVFSGPVVVLVAGIIQISTFSGVSAFKYLLVLLVLILVVLEAGLIVVMVSRYLILFVWFVCLVKIAG